MLHIILLILKILGFLLLGILGLVILLAAVFLISPVVYRADVSVDNSLESLKGKFRFHWLFRLISGSFSYEDGTFEWSLRAAWKRFGSGGTADGSMSGPVGTGAAERKTKAKERRPAGKDKTAGEKPIPAEKEDRAAAQKQIPAKRKTELLRRNRFLPPVQIKRSRKSGNPLPRKRNPAVQILKQKNHLPEESVTSFQKFRKR